MKAGRWVHIAVSWDEEEARLFVNGMLVSVSDRWEVTGGQYERFALGGVVYGRGRGAGGAFDELRLSASKRYVASFPVLSAPVEVESGGGGKAQDHQPGGAPNAPKLDRLHEGGSPGERRSPPWSHPGLTAQPPFLANFAIVNWGSNRPLPAERDAAGNPLLRLRRNGQVGDVLFVARPNRLNRFLGRLEVRVRLSEPLQLPAVLFAASDIVFNERAGRDRTRRTGWRILFTEDRRLQWQSLDDGSIVGQVQSEPLAISSSEWRRFGVCWRASRITLVYEGVEVASAVGQGLPSALPRYVYVGSRSTGQHTLDGWVSHVEIDQK